MRRAAMRSSLLSVVGVVLAVIGMAQSQCFGDMPANETSVTLSKTLTEGEETWITVTGANDIEFPDAKHIQLRLDASGEIKWSFKDISIYENGQNSAGNLRRIEEDVKATCEGEDRIYPFKVEIEKANLYEPKFLDKDGTEIANKILNIEVPMPLPSGVPLSSFDLSFIAEDRDIYNTGMNIVLGTEFVKQLGEPEVKDKNKQFLYSFETKHAINEEFNFTVTITDEPWKEDGDVIDPQSAQLTVYVKKMPVDEESITFEYTTGDPIMFDIETGAISDIQLTLKNPTANVVTIGFEEYDHIFKGDTIAIGKEADKQVSIQIQPGVSLESLQDEKSIQLVVQAKVDDSVLASTSLKLTIQRAQFEKPLYSSLGANEGISDIKLQHTSEADYTYAGGELIGLNCNEVDKSDDRIINCVKTIPSVRSTKPGTLKATNTKTKTWTETQLVIEEIDAIDVIVFTQPIYSGVCDIDTNAFATPIIVEIDRDIAVEKLTLDGTEKDNFGLEAVDGNTKQFKLIVAPGVQLAVKLYTLTVNAADGTATGQTTVAVDGFKNEIKINLNEFEFEHTFASNDAHKVTTIVATCTSGAAVDLNLKAGTDANIWGIDKPTGELSVLKAVPRGTYPVVIVATVGTVETSVGLSLTVDNSDEIKFDQAITKAQFRNSDTTIVGDLAIKVHAESETAAADIQPNQITIDPQEAKDRFTPSYDKTTKSIKIAVKQGVQPFPLTTKALTFTVNVETTYFGGIKASGQAVVSMEILHDNDVKFVAPSYVGTLKNSDGVIAFTNPMQISASGDVEFDTKNDKITCNLKTGSTTELECKAVPGQFPTERVVRFELIAKLKNGVAQDKTDVTLEVLQDNPGDPGDIEFEEKFYLGKLTVGKVDIEWDGGKKIILKTSDANVEEEHIKLDDIKGYFEQPTINGNREIELKVKPNMNIPDDETHYAFALDVVTTDRKGSTLISLTIVHKQLPAAAIEYAHQVIKVEEQVGETQTNLHILDAHPDNNWKYCIAEESPEEDQFLIDTDYSIKMKSQDRESEEMKKMSNPQYTLVINLIPELTANENGKCPDTATRGYIITEEGINMPSNSKNDPKVGIITVIIDDANDNPPVFTNGEDREMVICYPSKDLLNEVRPEYLVKVQATDEDRSKYGQVVYSSDQPDYLVVDKVSGVVQPTNAMYEHETKIFGITASDNNDESGALKTTLELTVHIVDSEKMAKINVKTPDIDAYLQKLSTETVTIRAMASSKSYEKIELSPANRFQRRVTTGEVPAEAHTTAYVYALETNEDDVIQPVGFDALIEFFKDQDEVTTTDRISTSSSGSSECVCDDTDGLIAAVAVLGVAVAILLVGGGVFWYRKRKQGLTITTLPKTRSFGSDNTDFRPDSPAKLEMQSVEVEDKQDDAEGLPVSSSCSEISTTSSTKKARAPSPPTTDQPVQYRKQESRGSDVSMKKKMERRATGFPIGVTPPEESDEDETLENSDNDHHEVSPKEELAKFDDLESVRSDATQDTVKSVTFNNEVKKSTLYEDAPVFSEDHDSHSGHDNDGYTNGGDE